MKLPGRCFKESMEDKGNLLRERKLRDLEMDFMEGRSPEEMDFRMESQGLL